MPISSFWRNFALPMTGRPTRCGMTARLITAALFLAAALGCGESENRRQPQLVLLYATCSLNLESLSPYGRVGGERAPTQTPNFERFAKRSALLQRHQTESGQSGTSFASIFTGHQAPFHQIYSHPQRISPKLKAVASRFGEAGYSTHSWLEHLMAGAPLGYAEGVPPQNRRPTKLSAEDPDFLALLDRLAEDPSERAFVMTNFTVTHGPYRGRELASYCARHPDVCEIIEREDAAALRRLYALNHIDLAWNYEATVEKLGISEDEQERLDRIVSILYAADVEHLDRIFGEVVAAIDERGLADRTVMVFTSDHGEVGIRKNLPFRWTHGMQLAPDVLNVPAMVFAPGQGIAPLSYQSVSRSIDILPTLLSLSGIPSFDLPGVDLAAALRGEASAPSLTAFSHTALLPAVFYQEIEKYPPLLAMYPEWTPEYMRVGLRREDDFFQLIPGGDGGDLEPALYDVGTDKGKERNLFDPQNPLHQDAIRDLHLYRQKLIDAYKPLGGKLGLPRREQESRLRALGYIE